MLDLFANPRFYAYDNCCPYCGKISPGSSYGEDPNGIKWEKCDFCKARHGKQVDKNITPLRNSFAMVEGVKRREYEKVVQANEMYKAAKSLGFPEKVLIDTERSYYVIVSIPSCFDSKNIVSTRSSPIFFIRVKLDLGFINTHDQFLSDNADMIDIPDSLLWLLACMKLFYKKDWDGREWIDEKEGFKYEETTSTCSELSQVSQIHEELVADLAKKMAEDIDAEIMKAIKKDPDGWKVQVGNTVYHGNKDIKISGV